MYLPWAYRSCSEVRETAFFSDLSDHPEMPLRSSTDRDLGTRRFSRRSAFSAAWSSAICRPACASDRRTASTGRWSTRTRGSRSSKSLYAIPSSRFYESSYLVGFLDAIISPRCPPFPSSTPTRSHRVLLLDRNNLRSWIMRGNATGVSGKRVKNRIR